jgi:uncharacterized iron-regulated protein
MKNVTFITALTFSFAATTANTAPFDPNAIYDGRTLTPLTPKELVTNFEPGSVVIISEIHDNTQHHQNQITLLKALADRDNFARPQKPTTLSLGMEFFEYPIQPLLNQFLQNQITEPDFLKAIQWGSQDFGQYRQQVLTPPQHGGTTLALNAPKILTRHVSLQGLKNLPNDLQKLMPPQFALGNDLYFERFKGVMSSHVPPEKLKHYFASQSIWDDTMAWKATDYIQNNPEQILVMIVGDFHVSYGGGLPDRLRARTQAPIYTISQVDLQGLSSQEIQELIEPHPRYGARADYIWTASSASGPVANTP